MNGYLKIFSKFKGLGGCLVLCVMIFTPFIFGIMQTDKGVSSSENRTLLLPPSKPENLKDFQNYPRLFEAYYADHFGFRDWFIKKYKTIKYKIGDSPTSDLTIGRDGWLFLGGTKDTYSKFQDPFGDVRNKNLYTDDELKVFAQRISSFEAWLEKRDIAYVFVIPPNKHTVYFDKLPKAVKREAPQSALDQLIAHLQDHTNVEVLDLRAALQDERKKHEVYHKTDTHWNHYGANRAQYEILKTVEARFPGVKPPKQHELKFNQEYFGDLATMLGVEVEGDTNPQPIFSNECLPKNYDKELDIPRASLWRCDTQPLKALLYHDSFFVALKPYFIRYFSQSTYIAGAATSVSVREQIAIDKPDVLIEEWVERKLPRPYVASYDINEKDKNTEGTVKHNSTSALLNPLFAKLGDGLKFHQMNVVSSDNTGLDLISTGGDPIIYLPDVNLKSGENYVLHVQFKSDVKSVARLYYSTSDNTKFPFSDLNSIRLPVDIGENDLFFEFSSLDIGNRLRLDLLTGAGRVKITNLELTQSNLK